MHQFFENSKMTFYWRAVIDLALNALHYTAQIHDFQSCRDHHVRLYRRQPYHYCLEGFWKLIWMSENILLKFGKVSSTLQLYGPRQSRPDFSWLKFKGSPDSSHFTFVINFGKSRIQHITTLSLNFQPVFSQPRNSSFNFRVVLCRIRLSSDIDFKNKMAWVWTTLKPGTHGPGRRGPRSDLTWKI